MTDHRMDILGKVPQEIAEMIFEYLRPEDLVNCSRVSVRWAQLVSHDRVWSRKLPYHKYVKEYWHDAVGESYDEGEGCLLMKCYLTESRIKNNKKQGKYNVITSAPFDDIRPGVHAKEVWRTVTGEYLLTNGDPLKFKDPLDIDLRRVHMTLSSDLRLLAVPYKNFLFIYERKPPTVEFELLSLLAARPATEKEPDGLTTTSLVCCPELDKESVALFLRKYRLYGSLKCVFFTGIDSLSERRVCLQLYSALGYKPEEPSEDESEEESEDEYKGPYDQQIYVLWDISRNRLVHKWRFDPELRVEEGWDKRGVRVTYETNRGCYKRIEYYDVDMRPLTVIPINGCHFRSIVMSYNFSVAIIGIAKNENRLAVWTKDSTEYRVLIFKLKWDRVSVGPSTVTFQLDKKTMAIIAAPDWHVVAHVKTTSLEDIYDFSLTEFSDSSLFVVKRVKKGYVWQDIQRRNTTKTFGRLITTAEHKMILPECLCIVFNKGVKLAIFAHTMNQTLLTIIDYDK